MRILIAAVGRAGRGPHRELYEHYAGRITWPLRLKEVVVDRTGPGQLEREGERLAALLPEGAIVVALDEHGQALTSQGFAGKLRGWRDHGVADIAFLIGGADGLAAALKARADLLLALGAVTWPHLLVRALLAEQLYRAQQILAGHPYHRG
jgi:23S rRNA (pseudouridine1915-N3)-methyltransferase